jgi:hypothetical protein
MASPLYVATIPIRFKAQPQGKYLQVHVADPRKPHAMSSVCWYQDVNGEPQKVAPAEPALRACFNITLKKTDQSKVHVISIPILKNIMEPLMLVESNKDKGYSLKQKLPNRNNVVVEKPYRVKEYVLDGVLDGVQSQIHSVTVIVWAETKAAGPQYVQMQVSLQDKTSQLQQNLVEILRTNT